MSEIVNFFGLIKTLQDVSSISPQLLRLLVILAATIAVIVFLVSDQRRLNYLGNVLSSIEGLAVVFLSVVVGLMAGNAFSTARNNQELAACAEGARQKKQAEGEWRDNYNKLVSQCKRALADTDCNYQSKNSSIT